MAEKPVIFLVDDEPAVLAAVTRDVQARYGESYRIMRAGSGADALTTLAALQERATPVALMLVDQRMPGMTGVELLREAIAIYPDVKRALLTAYADTQVAIEAINELRLDHYLLKPWDPPEDSLYPVLDDLLDEWLANYQPPFEGVQVIGPRWSAQTFALKDFLAGNLTPFRWIDIERAEEEAAGLLARAGLDVLNLPVVLLPDGRALTQPTQMELATAIGLETAATLPAYDLIIIGAGPAGLAAAVYGASEGLKTLLIERHAPGGQAGSSSRIENYLGFPAGLSGGDLARRAVAQARRLGAEILNGDVVGLRIDGQYRIVQLAGGAELSAQALLIATGVAYRRLDVPGIERLQGAGVYYGGALSEAIASRGEDVFIVGGANSAGQAAMHFAGFARCVNIVVRGDDLAKSMSSYLVERVLRTEVIRVWYHTNVVEAMGEEHLDTLRLANSATGAEECLHADGLFIFIGAEPPTAWLNDLLALDAGGYALSGTDFGLNRNAAAAWPLRREPFFLETNVPGIFVAGDVRHRSMKRIASATGEGAMAIQLVHQYLGTL